MQIPEMSSLRQTNSSNECDNSTSRAVYAAERARLLFGCYRKGDANDPETYAAAIAAVLAMYDEDTIRHVTDPRTGIAAKTAWMPNPGEVKTACEEYSGPRRRAEERKTREEQQLAERRRLAPPAGPRKTYNELIQSCVDAGLDMGKRKSEKTNVDTFLKEHSITREQFDALPNAPEYKWK